MKKFLAVVCLAGASVCQGALVFSDTFTAVNGTALVGHTPDSGGAAWVVDNGSANPLTINNNAVSLANNGVDDRSTFSSAITATAGNSLYIGVSINISAGQSTGDYFLNAVANGGASDDRLYAKSTTGGFLLGLQTSTSGTLAYGTTVLSLNTLYQVVFRYDFVNGLANDTMSVYVNPISGEENNTAYVTTTGTGGTDPTSITGIMFRQGSSTAAATLTADNLMVGATFADIVPVPEPAEWGLISAIGLLGICGVRTWREQRAAKHATLA